DTGSISESGIIRIVPFPLGLVNVSTAFSLAFQLLGTMMPASNCVVYVPDPSILGSAPQCMIKEMRSLAEACAGTVTDNAFRPQCIRKSVTDSPVRRYR